MPGLMVIIGGNANKLKSELDRVGHMISSTFASRLAGIASIGAIEEVARRTAEYAESVSVLSQRLGISTDAVQAWDYALKMNGSSIQNATKFFEKLALSRQKALKGNTDLTQSFKNFGITLDDLKNKRLEDLASQIAQAFKAGDPQKLIADLRDVGGRGAGEMVAAFRSGLKDFMDDAREMGIIIGKDTIDGLREGMEESKTVWMQFRVEAATELNAWIYYTKYAAFEVQSVWAMMRGYLKGGITESRAEIDRVKKDWSDAAKMRLDRLNARKKSFSGGADDEDTKAEAKREKEAEMSAKRILNLKEELSRIEDATSLKQMTAAEKVIELTRRKAEIDKKLAQGSGTPAIPARAETRNETIYRINHNIPGNGMVPAVAAKPGMSEEDRLKLEIEKAKINEELAAAEKPGKTRERMSHGGVTSLQQIGGYTSPASATLIDVNRKMEHHLSAIHKAVTEHNGHSGLYERKF